jgi:hypothetical protein
MEAPDLRNAPPRRWSDENNGIRWLPRLTDKTRAAIAGTLGGYLYGQSPVDRDLLRALGIHYREFTQIVQGAPDDSTIFTALAACTPDGIERAREWSKRLPSERRLFIWIIDVDDGYVPALRWLLPAAHLTSNLFTATIKRIWPSRATEPPHAAL